VNPLVSVIIPTFNHAHFLRRALQSVIDQTYLHWEALVIDNHSQDNTDEVVTSVGDPRIRLLKIYNHGIIGASRNLGMREAKGEWLAFLDSDDCWYPGKLQIVMAAIAADSAYDVLSNDELMVDMKTGAKQVLRYGPYEDQFYQVLLVEGNRLSPSATVIRRDFIARHQLAFDENQDYVTVEDYGFWLEVARAGARFKFIHDVQGEYVIHEANSSGKLSRHWKNLETLLHHHVFNIQQFEASPDKLWKRVMSRVRLGQVRLLSKNHEWWKAFSLALKTLISFPRDTTACLLMRLKTNIRKMSP